jgi:hypothetical protein
MGWGEVEITSENFDLCLEQKFGFDVDCESFWSSDCMKVVPSHYRLAKNWHHATAVINNRNKKI